MLNDFYQSLNPIAFALGPFVVRWYGIAYVLGFICAGLVVYCYARHWKIRFDSYDVLVFVCYCAFGIVIGARLGYCLFYGDGYYLAHPLEILAVNKGGMSFHGGLIGVVIAGAIYARVYKMPFLSLADLVVCGVPAGLFFGRCANFTNGELYGAPTDWPVGVDFTHTSIMYQPSQLYEALLEGVVIFLIMFAFSRKANPPRPPRHVSGPVSRAVRVLPHLDRVRQAARRADRVLLRHVGDDGPAAIASHGCGGHLHPRVGDQKEASPAGNPAAQTR